MENRYIYHYCAVNGNVQLSGIAQLTFRIKSQEDLEKLKDLIAGADFSPRAISSLTYLGRENDDRCLNPQQNAKLRRRNHEEINL